MRYRTPHALEMAVKAAAKASPLDTNLAISSFYFHRLLCRVFSEKDCKFVLKGGLSVLARTVDARATRDIDLLAHETEPGAAVEELKRLASVDHGFNYVVNAFLVPTASDKLQELARVSFPGAIDEVNPPFSNYIHMWALPASEVFDAFLRGERIDDGLMRAIWENGE